MREGQTLAAARARCATLRSTLLAPGLLAEAGRLAVGALLEWTPRVSPDGVARFWCEPLGPTWVGDVRDALTRWGPVQVGVGPWAAVAWGAARVDAGHVDADHLAGCGLDALELEPRALEGLRSLGVRHVHELRALDPVDLGVRFGAAVADAWRRAGGDDPRGPRVPRAAHQASVCVDFESMGVDVELDRLEPLLFVLRPALDRLLREPRGRGLGVTALHVRLRRRAAEGATAGDYTIRCGEPIADARLLLELVRTHLERAQLRGPTTGFELTARELAELGDRNVSLFAEARRDPAAREVALTRLAGRFGADAVRRASRVELASALARAIWTDGRPAPGPAMPWRHQHPPAPLEGEWIELAGRRRKVKKLGRVERALAPFWVSGVLTVERLAWAEVDGPMLVMLRAAHTSRWEAVAFVD